MCTGNPGCGQSNSSSNLNTKFKKPSAMMSKSVSKSSTGFSFGPYGARKASEVIGRTKMPSMPTNKRSGRQY